MLKRVTMYTDPKDTNCAEVRSFLEEQDIHLHLRNIKTDPLESLELSRLLRHFDLKHFLNADSKAYKKNRLDKSIPGREEIIELIAGDNDLLRIPIIVSGRLMTVGCNRNKIVEMLQLKNNGSRPTGEVNTRPSRVNSKTKK